MIKSAGRHSAILVFFLLILLCFSIGFFAWLKIDTNEQQIKLEALMAHKAEIVEENENLDYFINVADDAELYEHLARERGYVYPDEKVYFNITPGN